MDSQINRLRKWADWGGRVKPAIRKELSEAAAAIEAQAARIAELEAVLRGIVAEAIATMKT